MCCNLGKVLGISWSKGALLPISFFAVADKRQEWLFIYLLTDSFIDE